jgi:hypothetical protein
VGKPCDRDGAKCAKEDAKKGIPSVKHAIAIAPRAKKDAKNESRVGTAHLRLVEVSLTNAVGDAHPTRLLVFLRDHRAIAVAFD